MLLSDSHRTAQEASSIGRVEESLNNHNELLLSIYNTTLYGMSVLKAIRNSSGKIEDFLIEIVNKELERETGRTDLVGKLYLEEYPGIKEAGIYDLMMQTMETGEPRGMEYYYPHEGFNKWFSCQFVKLDDGLVATNIDITKRKNAEEEILRLKDEVAQKATDRYYSLFSSIDEGFCIIELIYDEKGKAVDYRFLQTNAAFQKHTGLKVVLDKTSSEISSNPLESFWLEEYDKVIQTGQSRRLENFHEPTQRWYTAYASRIGGDESRELAIVFDDISERKSHEWRQQLLLQINDMLQAITESDEIQDTVMQFLGSQLGLSRAYYFLVEPDDEGWVHVIERAGQPEPGRPGIAGRHSLTTFGSWLFDGLEKGKVINVPDVASITQLTKEARTSYDAMGIAAFLNVPLLRNGSYTAGIAVHSAVPRNWTPAEIAFIREVAMRTWDAVEKARAEEALRNLNATLEQQVAKRTGELNKSQEQLERNLTILQQAEALAQIGSWEYHFDTQKFTWSHGMYELFNIAPGTIVTPEIYIHSAAPEDKGHAEQLAYDIREGILPLPGTVCIQVADVVKMLKLEATIVNDQHGSPLRMIGVDMDITAAREAERTLRDQAHFIQSTNDALPDILYVADIATKEILYINHSFEQRLGYETQQNEEHPGNLLSLIYEEDVPGMLSHFEEMKNAEDGQTYEHEYRIKASDGDVHWFRDRNAVFKRDKSGVPVEKIGIAQDITERKKAEQELRESNLHLSYANENLRQFASIASHDLQEPLRKLKLFAADLARRYGAQVPAEGKELIRKMTLTTDRMRRLITEVLEYSRIAYGISEFVPTDLHVILMNLMSDLDLLMEETGTRLNYHDDLPTVRATPPQMNQLFYNLLVNAIKFRKTDVPLLISISSKILSLEDTKHHPELKEEVSYIEIIVADNGIGFDQQFANQIFKIFERLHSTDEYEGTGVGLALCKKIVENHYGHIYAVSQRGEGAAFHIILPLAQ